MGKTWPITRRESGFPLFVIGQIFPNNASTSTFVYICPPGSSLQTKVQQAGSSPRMSARI